MVFCEFVTSFRDINPPSQSNLRISTYLLLSISVLRASPSVYSQNPLFQNFVPSLVSSIPDSCLLSNGL